MNPKSQKDFYSGLMFILIGVAFATGAGNYTIGNGAQMGPGYFPLLLGVMLAILGGGIAFKACVAETMDGDKVGAFAWKPLFFIICANLVFGVCIGGLPVVGLPPLGLVIGIFLLTVIACKAGDQFNLKQVLVLGAILAAMSYVAFILLLKLQLPVWPFFLKA